MYLFDTDTLSNIVKRKPSGRLLEKLKERQAECIVFSNDETACAYGEKSVRLPADVPEWLSPVCAVLPGQMFSYRLAEAKGHDVDQPKGLSKVTITR